MFFKLKIKIKKIVSVIVIWAFATSIISSPVEAFWDFFSSEETVATVPEIERTKIVSVLVEEELLENSSLEQKIGQYVMDVQNKLKARVILVPIPKDVSPFEIFEGNAHLYFSGEKRDGLSQLVGTVLIGDVPLPIVEKDGAIWPSVFPYTDFENTVYEWDEVIERFVFQGNEMQSEIWHGIIRSDEGGDQYLNDTKLREKREEELIDYFVENHKVYTGETTYGKKMLFVDMSFLKEGLNEKLRQQYDLWVEHMEDFAYYRYNKHWLQKIQGDVKANDAVPWDMLPPASKPSIIPDLEEASLKIPDIHTKAAIDVSVKRYHEAWNKYLKILNNRFGQAGRWDPKEIDTTISLVGWKDEAALFFLKGINDTVEKALDDEISLKNLATDISVPTEDSDSRSLYWNGVTRTTMDSADCSLLRGKVQDDNHPYAQMVEANRGYYSKTLDCATDDDSQSTKDADLYEGCCAENLDVDANTLVYSLDRCDTGSVWNGSGVHIGAQLPVFDIAGTKEVFSGNQGSSGCDSIIDIADENELISHRFDSLMIHNEPTAETISRQIEVLETMSIPVDDPRGFSFYDHGKVFHRLDYFNVFDFRNLYPDTTEANRKDLVKADIETKLQEIVQGINTIVTAANIVSNNRLATDRADNWPGTTATGTCNYSQVETNPDSFLTRIEWTETCVDPVSSATIVRFYETGTTYNENLLLNTIDSFDLVKIVENLLWLDKNLDIKNKEVFNIALGKIAPAKEFFFDKDFNGYEAVEIIGERIESYEKNDGMHFSFEQIVENESGDYERTKTEAESFVIGEADNQSFAGFNFEDKFLNKQGIADKCKSDNFLEEIECYATESQKKSVSTIRKDPKTGEMLVYPAFEKKTVLDEIASVYINPKEIRIAGNNRDIIPVQVLLKNNARQVVGSDYSTEITLKFSSSAANKFFTTKPSISQKAKAGEVTFLLTPRENDFGGDFSIYAEANGKKSTQIPVLVSREELAVFPSKKEIIVNDKEGVLLSMVVQDLKKTITDKHDGVRLKLSSVWGTFETNSVVIVDGKAEVLFFPGTKSGTAIIKVEDENKQLSIGESKIKIIPDVPIALKFESGSNFITEGMDFIPVSVQLIDKYGNEINDMVHDLSWETDGLVIKTIDDDEFELQEQTGETTIFIKPARGAKDAEIEVESSVISNSLEKEIPILSEAVIKVSSSEEATVVGNKNPIEFSVWSETTRGQKIQGKFDIDILADNPSMGDFPSKIELVDGIGRFKLFPGTKSGIIQLRFVGAGFEDTTFDLKLTPEKPAKIQLQTSKKTIDLANDTSMNIGISVIDKYGNLATNFNNKVYLSFNEPIIRASEANDVLKDLGIVGEYSNVKKFLDDNPNSASKSPANDSELLKMVDGRSISLLGGQKTVKVESVSKVGKVFMTAKFGDLVPAVIDFEVTDYLTNRDIENLYLKSLFAMVLGFEAGDRASQTNFANQVLHSGVQAVGTIMTDPSSKKRIGFVSTKGDIASDNEAEFLSGEYFDVAISSSNGALAKTRVKTAETPELLVKREVDYNESGLYFIPIFEQIDNLKREDNKVLFKDKEIFSVSMNGGIMIKDGELEFTISNKDSILEWNVKHGDEELGVLHIVIGANKSEALGNFDEASGGGIFSVLEAEGARMIKGLTGKSTNDPLGVIFISESEKESRVLEAPYASVENAGTDENVGWKGPFKPMTLFAAGNTVGESIKWGSSDAFVLLGDPTISLASANTRSTIGIKNDIGKPIWKSPNGQIDQTLIFDINADGNGEILNLVGQQLFILYQDSSETDNFRSVGPILRFPDGVRSLAVFDNGSDGFWELIQINEKGVPISYKNNNGILSREGVMDLGINTGIREIKGTKLNGDEYQDLVVFDDQNNLYKILGNKNKFDNPIHLYDLSPNFEEVTESYHVAENQDPNDKYFDSDKFKYLSKFFVSYDGLKENLKGIDEVFIRQFKTFETPDTRFVSAEKNPLIDCDLNISQQDQKMIKVGDELEVKLTTRSDVYLSNFQIIVPKFDGMERVKGTLECDGCIGNPEFKKRTPVGEFWLFDVDIPAGENVIFTWNVKIEEMSPIKYYVDDYEGTDGQSDIVVPWAGGENGNDKLIKFNSTANPSHTPTFTDIVNTATVTEDSFFGDKSTAEVITEVTAPLKTDTDGDGYPDMYDDSPLVDAAVDFKTETPADKMEEVLTEFEQKKDENKDDDSSGCMGPGGLESGLPMSVVLLAPGFFEIYVPPLSVQVGFDVGLPVFWIPPPPISPTYHTSAFRFYVAPVIPSGDVAMGLCTGSYPTSIIPPLWVPNCFAITLPGASLCDGNEEVNSGGVFSKINKAFSFGGGGNQQISAVDVVTMWLQNQYREISNLELPTIAVKLPELTKEEKTGNLAEDVANNPLLNIEPELIRIPLVKIPEGSTEEIEEWQADLNKDIDEAEAENAERKTEIAYTENKNYAWNPLRKLFASVVSESNNTNASAAENDVEQREKYLKDLKAYVKTVDENKKALEGYEEAGEKAKGLPDQFDGTTRDMLDLADKGLEYFEEYFNSTGKTVKEWADVFASLGKSLMKSLDIVPQVFSDFTKNNKHGNGDRGRMQELILRIVFMTGVKLPTLPVNPPIPWSKITFDFTDTTFGLEAIKPELEFVEVPLAIDPKLWLPEITIPPLKPMSDFAISGPDVSANINVPIGRYKLPAPIMALPAIPSIPDYDIAVPKPDFAMPSLPVIPSPPSIPDILGPIEAIIQIPKALLSLMGMLVMGIAPVPEWNLKQYIAQLTNRGGIFKLDFGLGALAPVSQKSERAPEKVIKVSNNFTESIDAMSLLAHMYSDSFGCAIDGIMNSTKGGTVSDCSIAYDVKPPTKNIVRDYKTIVLDYNKIYKDEESVIALEKKSIEFEKLMAAVKQNLESEGFNIPATQVSNAFKIVGNTDNKLKTLSSLSPAKTRNWLASTIDVAALPTEVPAGFDTESFVQKQAEGMSDTRIYYYDPSTDASELLTSYPTDGVDNYLFIDFEDDGNREIFYSIGKELYLKRLVDLAPKVLTEDEEKAEQVFYSDFIEWDYETFIGKFMPVKNIGSTTMTDGTLINFERFNNDVFYFEWVLSERPDQVFEMGKKPSKRSSKKWHREAFIIYPEFKRYEIRPMKTQVSDIYGSPIIYAAPEEEIELIKQKDCSNPEVVKPFFPTESLLLGKAAESRMEVIVPAREGEEETYEEKILRAGEETIVEYAEVCLTRGEVTRVSMEDVTKIEPREYLYLPNNARVELGQNDSMELTFFDGTEVLLNANETYSIHYFEAKKDVINYLKSLKVSNNYGHFFSQKGEDKSYFVPSFLHDPQIVDDQEPPAIKITGGDEIKVLIFEDVKIDATSSRDDQKIVEVWWDLNISKDTDGDGDLENDKDFPRTGEASARELLNVSLPAYGETGKFFVVLNTKDEAGNHASKKITITVIAPILSLYEASTRSQQVLGRIEGGLEGVEVQLMRKRNGIWEILPDHVLISEEGGNFETEKLDLEGGIRMMQANKPIVEIAENGLPVSYDKRVGYEIESATAEHSMRIRIRDEANRTISFVSFEYKGEGDVMFYNEEELPETNGIFIRDLNKNDSFEFKSFYTSKEQFVGAVALINERNETIAVLDKKGDFYILLENEIKLSIKEDQAENLPIIFEIRNNENVLIGEFFIKNSVEALNLYKNLSNISL